MSKKPAKRPLFLICVARDNSYAIRTHTADGNPPEKVLIPFVNPSDPRFFVRNGELIKPYGVTEFAFQRAELCPDLGHDRAFYHETGRREFDPTGCVPIKYFDIEKVSDDLNAAQAMIERLTPEAPANANTSETQGAA